MEKNIHHINILVQLAKIDGHASDSELDVIRRIGSSRLVSDVDIEKVIDLAETADPIPDLTHFSKEEKMDMMYDLVAVMKADGIVHKEEMKFCLSMVQKLGFKDEALFELVSNSKIDDTSPGDKQNFFKTAEMYLKN